MSLRKRTRAGLAGLSVMAAFGLASCGISQVSVSCTYDPSQLIT